MFDDVTGPEQTTLIRVLVAVGIGLPILIEVATFGGMLSHHLVGGGSGGPVTDGTPTPEVEGVDTGDEILAAAAPTAHVADASVFTTDKGWQFVLTVNVTNGADQPVTVTLGTVTARNGATVDGTRTTGEVAPGEAASVTGSWMLPSGERPDSVAVTVVSGSETTQHSVRLGDIPVSNP